MEPSFALLRRVSTSLHSVRAVKGTVPPIHSEFVPPHHSLTTIDLLRAENFLSKSKRLFIITGAGVSTESGIKDYRSENVGLYATTNQRPTNYTDFLRSAAVRQRYWARNTTAWPVFSSFQPNISHKYIATLEHVGQVHWLVTQNVDSLHLKAGSRRVTELHGTMSSVVCLNCRVLLPRSEVQQQILALNEGWSATPEGPAPDADVFVAESAIRTFKTPSCERCGGILKPDVVFFGGTVPRRRVHSITERLYEADALLVIGSSVQTYSAFRYVKQASEMKIPVMVMNIGETRADPLANEIIRVRAGEFFNTLMKRHYHESIDI